MNGDHAVGVVRESLATAKDSLTEVHMGRPVEEVISQGRRVRTRRRVPALAAAAAVTAAAVVAVTSLTAGSRAGGGLSTEGSLRAHLLAAIDAARGDIIMSGGAPSVPGQHGGSGHELSYPWYPRTGQQVRIHTIGWDTHGKLFQDFESIFTMPTGHATPAINPVDGDTELTVTGTYLQVCPFTHTWGQWHHQTLTLGLPADAAGIRHQLATGQFKVIRRGVVDGRKAIELGMTGLNPQMTGLHATAALLWVDTASYLPLREVLRFSTGRIDTTNFRFLAPTASNLAKLRPIIPPGYHRTSLLPCQPHYK